MSPVSIAFVTDIHFGPEARFEGKLRKLSARAPELLAGFVERMNRSVRPSLVVNLGDDIEDESRELDRVRYREVVDILRGLDAPVVHVPGNHDTIFLSEQDLLDAWADPRAIHESEGKGRPRLYRSLEIAGLHVVVLHSREEKDRAVSIEDEQLAWLERDLAAARLPVLVLVHHSPADQVLGGNRWFEGRAHICLIRERKRLRAILERSGKVLLVVNGHLHWNHLDLHGDIPYVTVQSLIENLDDDAPGRPARAFGLATIDRSRVLFEVFGEETARYQFHRRRTPGKDEEDG